jgi:uncharacterized protein YjiK
MHRRRLYVTDQSPDALSVSDSLTHRASSPWFLKDIPACIMTGTTARMYFRESDVVVVSDLTAEKGDVAAPGHYGSVKGYPAGGG